MKNFLSILLHWLIFLFEGLALTGLLFLSLFLLRYQLAAELGMPWTEALKNGAQYGLQYDFALVCATTAIVLILYALLHFPVKISSLFLSWFVYIANLSNLLYFKYFGQRLDWWLVKAHIADVPSVLDSAGVLFCDLKTVLSFLVMVLFTVLVLLFNHYCHHVTVFKRRWKNWILFNHVPALMVAAVAIVGALNYWHFWDSYQRTGLLSAQVVKLWADQIAGYTLFSKKSDGSFVKNGRTLADNNIADPARVLADLQAGFIKAVSDSATEWADSLTDWPLEPDLPSAQDSNWPLLKNLVSDIDFSTQMRARMGLPATGKPNVIFLFVESFRSYELLHEEIGPAIFPNLRFFLNRRGIFFPRAYSSSWTSGQTARGQFSTQCSMMPNNQGVATYIGYGNLHLMCIQQLLKDNGYYTLWTSGTDSEFHNMGMFERLHGIDHFVEEDYYKKHGVKKMSPGWGLKDYEFLAESVKLLNNLAQKEQKPLYVNMSTLSTHHPQSVLRGYDVPRDILQKYVKNNEDYRKHLSRWHYEDAALGNFLRSLFGSQIGDNTLVVLVGDHSTPVKGEDHSNLLNLQETHSRIALALITKNMQNPVVVPWPVHQVDIVPTVAHIIGLEGQVSWIGRGLFSRPGTPWFYAFNGGQVKFNLGNRSCYVVDNKQVCYNIGNNDPLFYNGAVEEEMTPDDKKNIKRVQLYYRALMSAIVRNKLYPQTKN